MPFAVRRRGRSVMPVRLSLHWHTRGVVELPEGLDRTLRVASRLLLLVVLVVLVWEAFRGNLPRDPEGDFTDDIWRPLQLSLLGLTAVGLVISWRSLAVAAAIVALGGGLLGVV